MKIDEKILKIDEIHSLKKKAHINVGFFKTILEIT